MHLQLNFKSGLPVYLQIVEQVKAAAASGSLRPGESLPSIRPLAEHLRINRNTVAKAYSELENQGILTVITGKGCILSENHSPLKKDIRSKMLTDYVDAAIVQAHHFQVEPEALVDLVRKRLEFFARKTQPQEKS